MFGYANLVPYVFFALFPFYFMVVTSLKNDAELYDLKSISFLILCLPLIRLIRPIGSRRPPQVFVMEPTRARHLHYTALARRLHSSRLRCVLSQG